MRKAGASKTVFFLLLIAAAILSFFIVRPFLTPIIGGIILAYVFYPVYKKLLEKINNETISALLVAVGIIIIIVVPSYYVVSNITQESHTLYTETKEQISQGVLISSRCQYENGMVCDIVTSINSMLENEAVRDRATDILSDALKFITAKASDLILGIPRLLLTVFITLFITFYMLKDGAYFVRRLSSIIPMKVHHQDAITKQIGDVIYALIYGSIIVAVIQGILAGFGYWLFGLDSFMTWAILTTLFAFVPFIGTAAIWGTAGLYVTISGYVGGETAMVMRGVGLLVYGAIVISGIDNLIKPVIVAERAHIHPVLILVGVLGGLAFMGLIGVIVGPLSLAILQSLIVIYEREGEHHVKDIKGDILGNPNGHKRKKRK